MQYLTGGFQKVVAAVKKHPLLVMLIFILQVALLITSLYTALTYQVKIIQDAQAVIEPLQKANYDAESIKAGNTFIPNIVAMYEAYQSLIKNILTLAMLLGVLFLILNGIIWLISHKILETATLSWKETIKSFLRGWMRYALTTLVVMGPFFILSYLLLRTMLVQEIGGMASFTTILTALIYLFMVLYYFLLVAFAFLGTTSWKLFLHKIFTASIKRVHLTLLVVVINGALLFLSLYGVYYFMNNGEVFSFIAMFTLLFMILMVLTRLFWIACLQEITHEKDHS